MTKDKIINIMILCKVVDNYGDIGFVYRLARRISALTNASTATDAADYASANTAVRPIADTPTDFPPTHLSLVVSNLNSFASMAPGIKPELPFQTYNGWKIFDWNNAETCTEEFTKNEPQTILECFQCGRPEWLENILFTRGCKNIVNIINIDYLTAEQYADDFHCLQSATRSARVQKINFMPGFTSKTGGLVLDEPFIDFAKKNIFQKKESDEFKIIFFSYEQDCTPIIESLINFSKINNNSASKKTQNHPAFKIVVKVAAGKSLAPFMNAVSEVSKINNFSSAQLRTEQLSYLPQTEWDTILCSSSFNFVRGEDSLSRACLAGVPFLWHAYPQAENYQLVKVHALLDRMEQFFSPEDFSVLARCAIAYNTPQKNAPAVETFKSDLLTLFLRAEKMQRGFAEFSCSLIKNGDFAFHLLEYINK